MCLFFQDARLFRPLYWLKQKNMSYFWMISDLYKVVGDAVDVGHSILDLDSKDHVWSLTFTPTSSVAIDKPVHISIFPVEKSVSHWNAVKNSTEAAWQKQLCHEAKGAGALRPLTAPAPFLRPYASCCQLPLGLLLRFLPGQKFCVFGQWTWGRPFPVTQRYPVLYLTILSLKDNAVSQLHVWHNVPLTQHCCFL